MSNIKYIQEYSQRSLFMQMMISSEGLLIGLMHIYIVTDFLKASLGALAPTLCNNCGYVILADV
jgi:hypothetical protein